MDRENRIATLNNWSVVYRDDGLVITGTVWDHPDFRNGSSVTLGAFASFDFETMSGVSQSGRGWWLEDFIPNANVGTQEEVVLFIQQNYMENKNG